MRSLKFKQPDSNQGSWGMAVFLTGRYLTGNAKADQLLSDLPSDFTGQKRGTAQSLFYGALRHGHRVNAALKKLCKKAPQPELEAIFLVTGYELLSAKSERAPQIIHHAVEQSKRLIPKAQTSFLNAVLRKLPAALEAIDAEQQSAYYYSHPKWLVDRWNSEFPSQSTRELLVWNQKEPRTYVKLFDVSAQSEVESILEPTDWDGFYTLSPHAVWMRDVQPLLDSGQIYIKDPSTRLAPTLLAPESGQSTLDLCAAPGGKAFDLANSMQRTGTLVAVDLPGNRIPTLKENLAKLEDQPLRTALLEKDVLKLSEDDFKAADLPASYDAVMLDAPCSNTGVIQRRTDVKWRLRKSDIQTCATLQSQLLAAAATFVKSGGRLVYSTCSIEKSENADVVQKFLESESGRDFQLAETAISLPWETGHDGAGAFLLLRS